MKPTITRGLGALTPQVWSQLYELVQGQGADGGEQLSSRGQRTAGGDRQRFLAKITASTQIAARAIWRYEWIQVRVQTAEAAAPTITEVASGHSDSTQGEAWNILEMGNTANIAFGYGVTNGVVLTGFEGFAFEPVPDNTIVQMWFTRATNGALRAEFIYMNPIDGQCPEPPAPSTVPDFGTFNDPTSTAIDMATFGNPSPVAHDYGTFE
jgi:hypothetical protein